MFKTETVYNIVGIGLIWCASASWKCVSMDLLLFAVTYILDFDVTELPFGAECI